MGTDNTIWVQNAKEACGLVSWMQDAWKNVMTEWGLRPEERDIFMGTFFEWKKEFEKYLGKDVPRNIRVFDALADACKKHPSENSFVFTVQKKTAVKNNGRDQEPELVPIRQK